MILSYFTARKIIFKIGKFAEVQALILTPGHDGFPSFRRLCKGSMSNTFTHVISGLHAILARKRPSSSFCFFVLIFFFKDFLYLFMRDPGREKEREAETQAEGEAGSTQEPDAGLDPRTPGSRPGPKASA